MTFDLEKARAADEALPYPLDANEIWVSGKGQMHINPPNAPSIFFTLSDLCEFRNLFHGQAAEIERLTVEHQNALDEVKNLEEQIEVHHLRRENELRQMNEISAENKKLAARITELEDLVDWGIPEPTYGGEVI